MAKNSLVFSTKNNELTIFGNTIDGLKQKWTSLVDAFERDGLRGESGVFKTLFVNKNGSQIVPDNKLPQVLSYDEAKRQLDEFNNVVINGNITLDNYFDRYQKNNKILREYVTTTDQQSQSVQGLVRASQAARDRQIEQNNIIRQSTLAYKAQSIAIKSVSIAANMLITMGISAAISFIIKGVDNLIHSAEKCKERADNLVTSFKSALDTANSNAEKAEELISKYESLSKGINNLGENVSLTTDEYKEYSEVSQEIAEMFPSLIAGYTDEGNAILSLKGNVEQLRDTYKQAQQEAYNMLIVSGEDSDGNDILENYKNIALGEFWDNGFGNIEKMSVLDDVLSMSNVSDFNDYIRRLNIEGNVRTESFLNLIGYRTGITEEEFSNLKSTAVATKQVLQAEFNKALSDVELLANAFLMTNEDYKKLDEQSKKAASIMINSLNKDIVRSFAEEGDITSVGTYVNNIVDTINSNPKAKEAITELFTMDMTEMSAEDIINSTNKYIDTIAQILGENPIELKTRLGFDNINDLEEQYNRAVNFYAGENIENEIKEFFRENSINTQEEIDNWIKIAKGCKTAGDAMKQYIDLLNKVESPVSFVESIQELDKFSDGLSKIDNIYADVYDKEDFDFGNIINEDFVGIFGKYKNEYENFVNTIANFPDDIKACQSAFDGLVSAWLYGEDVLKNLTNENKNATIQYLKQNGVANATAIVTDVLAAKTLYNANQTEILADAKSILAAEDENAAVSANNNTLELLNQAGATSETINWVMRLVAEQTIFSNQNLSVEGKINALERLAQAYGQATFAANLLENVSKMKSSVSFSGAKMVDAVNGNTSMTESMLNIVLEDAQSKFYNLTAPKINYTGGSATNAAKKKDSNKDKDSGSKKEYETNDEYYNYFQAKIDDYKNGAEKLEEEIEKTNEQIEQAYKKGDLKLVELLKNQLVNQQNDYKDYLAKGAESIRNMSYEEILPIIYKIAPELDGKTIDQFTEEEKLKIKQRLDDEIIAQKNKVIDLENANKSNKNNTKVSEEEVKSAEKQLKIFEALYSTLDEIYNLVGNKNGQGEWSKNYRNVISTQIDDIKDSLDKDISQYDFDLSILEDMDNNKGQIDIYKKQIQEYHNAAEKGRKLGLEENSEFIRENQKKYREGFKKIYEIGNETFDRLIERKNDLISDLEFKIDILEDKEYDRNIDLINEKIVIHKSMAQEHAKERKKLEEQYKNNVIVAAEYEERIRSLNKAEEDIVSTIKEEYEAIRDLEIAKLDEQIEDITNSTEKQTKAIDKQIDALEKEEDELNKLKDLYDKAYRAVQKVINDETDSLNELKEKEEEYWNEKLETLEKINEETKRGIELSEKLKNVAKASQKTALVYHEDKGWNYEANPNELSQAQHELDQWLIDDQFEQAKKSIEEQKEAVLKSIEEQIESWDKYLEKWESAVNAYEEGENRKAAAVVIGANWNAKVISQNTSIITKFEKEYSDILSKIGDDTSDGIEKQIKELERQKEELEKQSDDKIEMLENEKKVWENLFSKIAENTNEYVSNLEEKFGVVIGKIQEARNVLADFNKDMDNVSPSALKPIEYNDEDIKVIKQMIGNSQQWAKSNTQISKDQLYERNKALSETLSFKTYFDSHRGTWLDENGNNIYDRLTDNYEITAYNSNSVKENSETIDSNIKMTEKSINVEKDMLKSSKSLLSENKILNKDINSLSDNIAGLDNTLKNTKFSTELNNNSTGNNNTNSSESNNNTSNSNDKLTSQNSNSIKAIPITLGENYALSDDGKYLYAKGSTVKLSSSDYVEINGVIYDIINSSVGDVKIGSTHSVNGYRYGINKYAKGSPYIPYDQRAIVDEEGEEFIAHREHGRIETLKKGDTVIPAKTSETLASLIDGNGDVKDSSESKEDEYIKAPYEISEILMKKYFQDEDSMIPARTPKTLMER